MRTTSLAISVIGTAALALTGCAGSPKSGLAAEVTGAAAATQVVVGDRYLFGISLGEVRGSKPIRLTTVEVRSPRAIAVAGMGFTDPAHTAACPTATKGGRGGLKLLPADGLQAARVIENGKPVELCMVLTLRLKWAGSFTLDDIDVRYSVGSSVRTLHSSHSMTLSTALA